mmetsp:Transcript_24253/g.35982  ORF Transcript_24253/g.35982 Transcript_24253/m.35982 type:complete len:104 (+) Transcript_24253:89-400(+)
MQLLRVGLQGMCQTPFPRVCYDEAPVATRCHKGGRCAQVSLQRCVISAPVEDKNARADANAAVYRNSYSSSSSNSSSSSKSSSSSTGIISFHCSGNISSGILI